MNPTRQTIQIAVASALVAASGILGATVALSVRAPVAAETQVRPSGGLELSQIPASDLAQNQPQPWLSPDPSAVQDGCPDPGTYPDIVSARDYAWAKADSDPLVLKCSIDRRP